MKSITFNSVVTALMTCLLSLPALAQQVDSLSTGLPQDISSALDTLETEISPEFSGMLKSSVPQMLEDIRKSLDSLGDLPVDGMFHGATFRKIGQDTSSHIQKVEQKAYIALHHKQYSDSVVLRWAPSTRSLWLHANQLGYVLTRTTLPRQQDGQPQLEYLSTLENPIRPYDSTRWARYFPNEDKYALIAAGATGGSLEVSADEGFAVKGSQDQSIFGFVLMSADFSRLAADGLGLRYVDTDVEPGEHYIYRVTLADSLSQIPIGQLSSEQQRLRRNQQSHQRDGQVHFGGAQGSTTIKGVKIISRDRGTTLQWPVAGNRDFSSYIIERSDDNGQTYDSLTSDPIMTEPVIVEDEQGFELGTFFQYQDDLEENYRPYTYRIIGLDAFADHSPPSIVIGMGKDLTPPENPILKSGEYLKKEEKIRLSWRLPEVPGDFDDLYFEYAYHADSTFVRYEEETLNPNDTVYYHSPEPNEHSHYFRMAIADTAGNVSQSFPIFVNIPDTIPPPVPTGLHARIDTTGEVDIQWDDELLAEKGFLGYRVYYSNSLKHEFTQLTKKPVNSNFYIYHIPIETLTEKIYYKVQAVDNSYNHSAFSEIIEVAKPDIRPPVAPVFAQPKANEKHIKLNWTPSPSEDVVSQWLYRKEVGNDEVAQFQLLGAASSYTDTSAQVGVLYSYQLQVEDDAGLRSPMSFAVRSKKVHKRVLDPVNEPTIFYNVETKEVVLSWEYQEQEGTKFSLYRALNTNKVKTFKLIDGSLRTFADPVSEPGTYYYAIRARGLKGVKSDMSDLVSISVE